MATKYELTWRDDQGGRWRKKYKGRAFYFPRRDGETKAASYIRCRAEWLNKKAQIDAEAVAPKLDYARGVHILIERTKQKLAELAAEDTAENRFWWSRYREALLTYEGWLVDGVYPFRTAAEIENPPDYLPSCESDDPDPRHYDKPPWYVPGPPASNVENSLAATIRRYLADMEQNAERGKLSRGRVDVVRVGLENFRDHLGPNRALASLTSADLDGFRKLLERRIDAEELRPHSARDRLQAVKQFVRWAWELELTGLPRILNSRGFSIPVAPKTIKTFSDLEVQRLLESSSDSTKLYLLLMLNCGMTQIDIAELTQAEVDWKAGRISRRRSKTRKNGNGVNCPTVSYQLWPETFRLLKAHRSKHPELALTNANGEPLKVETFVDGRVSKKDNIRSAYQRVVRKLAAAKSNPVEIDKPLKLLRKTAATKLGHHPVHGRFAQFFLGHAPTTVADRHYVAPSEAQFDEALAWLGTQFVMGGEHD